MRRVRGNPAQNPSHDSPRGSGSSRQRYSRLAVPRRGGDDALIGLLSLHSPLGFETAGKDLVAFFRDAGDARRAAQVLTRARVRHELSTDIRETDPFEAWRAASRPFPVGRRLWVEPGDADVPAQRFPRAGSRCGFPLRGRSAPASTRRPASRC